MVGVVGISSGGSVRNCINYNSVEGERYVGGVCGYLLDSVLENCGNNENSTVKCLEECAGGVIRIYCLW